jgi:amidase
MSRFFVPHDIKAPIEGAPAGPLAGLNFVVKDMYDVAGERAGGGNPDWLANQKPAVEHAAAVTNLLAAGGTLTGKTICDEFFYSVAGVNAHYGTPLNVRAPGRLPGGSSSGSAGAAAAGVCDFAMGSDTGGSIRVPASLCGLYGIRTTIGRVDARGVMDMAPSFDTIGWLAATPGVFRRVGTVLLDDHGFAAPVEQVLVADDTFAEADEPVARLLHDAIAAMKDALPKPKHVTIAPNGLDLWRDAIRVIQAYEVWQVYGSFIEDKKPRFGPGVAERMQLASRVTKAECDKARGVQTAAHTEVHAQVAPGTVLVIPSAPCIAPRTDTPADGLENYRIRVMRLTCIAGIAGLPQVSIPIGIVDGCPVGLSFVGWTGSDEVLLDLAFRLSKYCGRV